MGYYQNNSLLIVGVVTLVIAGSDAFYTLKLYLCCLQRVGIAINVVSNNALDFLYIFL